VQVADGGDGRTGEGGDGRTGEGAPLVINSDVAGGGGVFGPLSWCLGSFNSWWTRGGSFTEETSYMNPLSCNKFHPHNFLLITHRGNLSFSRWCT
jgi:hypothetical protein